MEKVEKLQKKWEEYFSIDVLETKKTATLNRFLSRLDWCEINDAMDNSVSKIDNEYQAWKYFCGICWNIIKEND